MQGVPVTTTTPAPPHSASPPPRALATVDPSTGRPGPPVVCASDAEVDAALARADAA
ncbi:MAG: hypothetical protein AVDCRST_MAG35-940, partial [uncultured Quadrisphaera sp.]